MINSAATSPMIPEETAEDLYENAPCGYMTTRPDGFIVRVNQTFLRQTGYEATDLLHVKRLHDLFTVPGRVFYSTHFGPLLLIQGFVKETAFEILRPGKPSMPVLINAVLVRGEDNEPSLVRYTIFEATERRRFESALLAARRSAEQYESIVRASAEAIISLGPDGVVRTWNNSAEKLFEISAKTAIGQHIEGLITLENGNGCFQSSMAYLRMGNTATGTDSCILSNGEKREISYTLTPHIEPPKELTVVSAIIRDITEQRRSEEAEMQRQLLESLVKVTEEERHRISRDLHDHIGGQLTAINLALSSLASSDNLATSNRQKLADIRDQLNRMDRDVTFLAFEMRPHALRLGLVNALENLAIEWERNYGVGIEVSCIGIRDDRQIASEIEASIYRLTQEALNNIGKHAAASQISIVLNLSDTRVNLIIEDNGVGFDLRSISSSPDRAGHGAGIQGMRERAELLGGELEIESTPKVGTTIYARIPVRFQ